MPLMSSQELSGPPAGPDVVTVALLAVTPADDLALRALLSEDERALLVTVPATELKRRMTASMVLHRALLAHIHGGAPLDWAVRADARGAPQAWLHGHHQEAVHSSRSRSEGLVAAAVSTSGHVGIDVEAVGAHGADSGLARQFFSLDEIEALDACNPATREDRFFRIWTLKEAYIKARGLGFRLPLDSFAVIPEEDGIRFNPPPDDAADRWTFRSLAPTPQHRLALACENAACDIRIGSADVDPASGEIRFRFEA